MLEGSFLSKATPKTYFIYPSKVPRIKCHRGKEYHTSSGTNGLSDVTYFNTLNTYLELFLKSSKHIF